jgi:UDP-glucuronate 4-epimerase
MAAAVLVTGAAGFIGSHLCECLSNQGRAVVGLDNFDPFYDRRVKEANVQAVSAAAQARGTEFRLYEGDIGDTELLQRLAGEHELEGVIHLAARAGVRPSIDGARSYARYNIEGTIALLEMAARQQLSRFIFASSSSVYGGAAAPILSEELPINHPISPYAASKAAGEGYCYTYHSLYGLPVVCLRLFTVYGPRQRPDLAINKFVRLMQAGQALPRYGDGTSRRDYTYVGDTVRGLVAAYDSSLAWEVINLGSGQPFTLNELIAALEETLGREALIEAHPPQPGDVQQTFADIRKARQLLQWTPQITLKEGLREFLHWWETTGKLYY